MLRVMSRPTENQIIMMTLGEKLAAARLAVDDAMAALNKIPEARLNLQCIATHLERATLNVQLIRARINKP
jgi:hypothetical protein